MGEFDMAQIMEQQLLGDLTQTDAAIMLGMSLKEYRKVLRDALEDDNFIGPILKKRRRELQMTALNVIAERLNRPFVEEDINAVTNVSTQMQKQDRLADEKATEIFAGGQWILAVMEAAGDKGIVKVS